MDYFPYSNVWHRPYNDYCGVCLAGAVIAKTLNAPLTSSLTSKDFKETGWEPLLNAIDYIRSGFYQEALNELNLSVPRW